MKRLFFKQVEYESWANMMVIEAVEKAAEPLERTWEILSHLVIMPRIWLERANNSQPVFKPWQRLQAQELRMLAIETSSGWHEFIRSKADEQLKDEIAFTFMGKDASISIEDLLIHLVNHSSYHRGQVILQLKGKLETLPLSTYIAFATNVESD